MATEEETAAAIEAVKLFVICSAAYNGFARPARAAWRRGRSRLSRHS